MSAPADRAKQIFLDALERAAEERPAYVEEACGDDEGVRRRVLELLEAHRCMEEVGVQTPAPASLAPAAGELRPGVAVGPYRLLREIGEGGFGVVWLAEQEEPLRRRVALKVLKQEVASREVGARFEAERQVLALMDHPSIARIYDAGTTPAGRPYMAMELVEGRPITEYCRHRDLELEERLQLFVTVCQAVQHAHQKGIVHRDIKPPNVLVAEVGGAPLPKVIDFGIAKAIERRLTEESLRTRDGVLLGTPVYMSPEQIGTGVDVDTRADVYSLGALLYELLCGAPPFDVEELRGADLAEVLRVVREEVPVRPSTRLLAAARRAEGWTRRFTRGLGREVRGDLDWITMRCLEKDRERRYESAAVLANEVLRYLRAFPVMAGPPDLLYRVSRFTRRHRALVFAGFLLVLAVGGGAAGSLVQAVRATRAEGRMRTELERYEAVSTFLQDLLMGIDPAVARGQDRELLLALLHDAAARVDADPPEHPEVEATLLYVLGTAHVAIASYSIADELLGRCVAIRERELGPNHQETFEALANLGGARLTAGDLAGAEDPLVRAAAGRSRTLGPEHPATLSVLGNLGTLRWKQGRLDDAEELLRAVEEARRRLLGDRHEDTLLAVNNLAGLLHRRGRLEEAAQRYGEALAVQQETLGEDHPRTLKAMNNLGSTLVDQGRYAEAGDVYRRALEAKRRVFGPEHPSVLVALNNLAHLANRQGDLDAAAATYREALELGRRTVGDRHEIVHHVLYSLGAVERNAGRPAEALRLLEEALDGFSAAGEGADLRRASCHHALAGALEDLDRPADAEAHARRSVELGRRLLPPGDVGLGAFLTRWGRLLAELGEAGEARAALTEALAILEPSDEELWKERAAGALAGLE